MQYYCFIIFFHHCKDLHKEYYLESVAECDAPTVFESVDCEILSQVSSSKSITSEVMKSSDYIQ